MNLLPSVLRSDVCKFESGVLPFESKDPKSLTFEAYEDFFGRPIQSVGPVYIGDKIKIFCVERGDIIVTYGLIYLFIFL